MMMKKKVEFRPFAFWLLILVFFTVYAWKVDVLGGVALYKLIYPISLFVFCVKGKFNINSVGKNLKISTYCWGILLLWGMISLCWIDIQGTEFDYLSYDLCWICIGLCFSAYAISLKNRDRLMLYFCIIAFGIGLMGLYTAFTGYYFNDTHVSYHYIRNYLGLYRPNTIFYNVNDNAVFMFFSIVILFLLTENRIYSFLFRIIGLLIFGGNILLVDSRGVELGLFVFLALYLFKTRKIKIIYKFMIIFGIAIFVFLSIESILRLGLFDEGISDSGRLLIIRMSLSSVAKTHFMGVGPGNISAINASLFSAQTVAPHNFFIEIFCDYGVVGLIVMIVWFGNNLKSAVRIARYDNQATVIWIAWVSFLIISIVSSSLMGKSWVACFFGIMVSYINSVECNYKEGKM